jgi:predicted RNA-binding protein with PUA-like domain
MEKKNPYEGGAWSAVFSPRAPGEKRYWLVKSEPEAYSFDDLMAAPKQTTRWDGIRNHTARNFLRDGMTKGDGVLFYHSSATPSAVVGVCEVVREGYPDPTALDPKHPAYDPKSTAESPTWFATDIRGLRALPAPIPLAELKKRRELSGMALLRIGRLSVTPVTAEEWAAIVG